MDDTSALSGGRRLFHAMVSTDPTVPAHRVTVWAVDVNDAMAQLESLHGKGNIFALHNAEDAARARGKWAAGSSGLLMRGLSCALTFVGADREG
jgi:hypothetical protein